LSEVACTRSPRPPRDKRDGIWVPRENAEEAASPLAVKEQLAGGEPVDTPGSYKRGAARSRLTPAGSGHMERVFYGIVPAGEKEVRFPIDRGLKHVDGLHVVPENASSPLRLHGGSERLVLSRAEDDTEVSSKRGVRRDMGNMNAGWQRRAGGCIVPNGQITFHRTRSFRGNPQSRR